MNDDTVLIKQCTSDMAKYEGFREYSYPDPLSDMAKSHRGSLWPWGFVPAHSLYTKIPNFNLKDGNPWTIGYGFTNGITADDHITLQEANQRLSKEVVSFIKLLDNNVPNWRQQPYVIQTVLVNLCYNMGIQGLLSFKNTLSKMQNKDYKGMAQGIQTSKYYNQVGQRAKDMVNRILTLKI